MNKVVIVYFSNYLLIHQSCFGQSGKFFDKRVARNIVRRSLPTNTFV